MIIGAEFFGSLKGTSCYRRFLLKKRIAVLAAPLLLSCCPTETTKACVAHLPRLVGLTGSRAAGLGTLPGDDLPAADADGLCKTRAWGHTGEREKALQGRMHCWVPRAGWVGLWGGRCLLTSRLPEAGAERRQTPSRESSCLLKAWLKHPSSGTANGGEPGLLVWF